MPAPPQPQPNSTGRRQISLRSIRHSDVLMLVVVTGWLAYVLWATRKAELIASDDAFISIRYARNLGLGQGLVFNPGERVWGFTSPLQTLLLGGATALGIDTVRAAFVLGFLWVAVATFLLYRVGAQLVSRTGACAVALFFLFDSSQHGVYALESNLLIVVQLVFLLALIAKSSCLGGLLAALACLTRPDSLLLVVPVLLARSHRHSTRALLCFLTVGLAWESFCFLYFESLLPQSFYAKAGFSRFFPFLGNAVKDLASCGLAKAFGIWSKGLAVQLPFLALSLLLLIDARVRRQFVLWFSLLLYPWLLILAYSWIGSFLDHDWELYSGRFMVCVSVSLGLVSLSEWAMRKLSRRTLLQPATATILMLLVAAYGGFHVADVPRELAAGKDRFWLGKRYLALREVADWVSANTPRDASIAVLEAGTLGHFSNRRVIDAAGIVTRGYLPEERMNLAAFLSRFEPTYALVYENTDALTIAPHLRYERVAYFPGRGYAELSVLRRQ